MSIEDMDEKFLRSNYHNVHCVIIDNYLKKELNEKVKNKFSGIPIICLPSLNGDESVDNRVKYINEPLRLSELGKVLDEIFQ